MKLNNWDEIAELTEKYGPPCTYGDLLIFGKDKATVYLHFYKNGELSSREFRFDGMQHRESSKGPAFENFHSNGEVCSRQYALGGAFHRPLNEGPAFQVFFDDGQLLSSEYWVKGQSMPTSIGEFAE
jgi:hypothetical protein